MAAAVIVMVANNTGAEARRLAATFPNRIGHLIGPGGWRQPLEGITYALDNGAFPAFSNGTPWNEAAFFSLLDRAATHAIPPAWVAVPDVVLDRAATLRQWETFAPVLRARYGWPLAFVVQNGMTPADVPAEASVVFVGGDTEWKRATARGWCEAFPRVHIGRVNTERWLWYFHRAGAESCDGSGWFRGKRTQLDSLWHYLADSEGLELDPFHGAMQTRLFPLGPHS